MVEIGVVKEEEKEEARVEDDNLVLDHERCNVAVRAKLSMVVTGSPALGKRNLPTPVSQQSTVWSQQISRLLFVTF